MVKPRYDRINKELYVK
ncbi:MAG: hypothetical protein ACEY3D_04355 [Rickettsia sp.]